MFYVNNLDVKQSTQTNDSASIVKRAKERYLLDDLLDNDQCPLNYDDKRFSILAVACSSFHLNLLEATYIKT